MWFIYFYNTHKIYKYIILYKYIKYTIIQYDHMFTYINI